MAVYLAAIALLSFYLCSIPLKFAWEMRIRPDASFGAGVAAFEGRCALRRAHQRMLGEKKHLPWKKTELDINRADALPAHLHAARYALGHMRLERLHLSGTIGTRDAAATALMCGLARSMQAALEPVAPPDAIQLTPLPDFSCDGSNLLFSGMISMKAGHIMLAALIGAQHYVRRRLISWKENIRLKISCARRWRTYATWWTWTRSSANRSSPRTARP